MANQGTCFFPWNQEFDVCFLCSRKSAGRVGCKRVKALDLTWSARPKFVNFATAASNSFLPKKAPEGGEWNWKEATGSWEWKNIRFPIEKVEIESMTFLKFKIDTVPKCPYLKGDTLQKNHDAGYLHMLIFRGCLRINYFINPPSHVNPKYPW